MSLLQLPPDILRKVTDYLDYKTCLIYFRISKRFLAIDTDIFWNQKMKNDFHKNWWKFFYKKSMYNYLACRYEFLLDGPSIVYEELKYEKIKAEVEGTDSKCILSEMKDLNETRNKEKKILASILISYLKREYSGHFEVIYSDYFIYNRLTKFDYNKYKEGKKYNLIINRKDNRTEIGFYLEEKQIAVARICGEIKLPHSFTSFIRSLGLELKDIWKLYDISESAFPDDANKHELAASWMRTVGCVADMSVMKRFLTLRYISSYRSVTPSIVSSERIIDVMEPEEYYVEDPDMPVLEEDK